MRATTFVAGDLAQRGDLLADGDGEARHGESVARSDLGQSIRGGTSMKPTAGARRGVPVHHASDTAAPPPPRQWLAHDVGEEADAALLGLPGRTQMVGRPMLKPIDEASAAVVGDQQLADVFCVP